MPLYMAQFAYTVERTLRIERQHSRSRTAGTSRPSPSLWPRSVPGSQDEAMGAGPARPHHGLHTAFKPSAGQDVMP